MCSNPKVMALNNWLPKYLKVLLEKEDDLLYVCNHQGAAEREYFCIPVSRMGLQALLAPAQGATLPCSQHHQHQESHQDTPALHSACTQALFCLHFLQHNLAIKKHLKITC